MTRQKAPQNTTQKPRAPDPMREIQRAGFGNIVGAQIAWLESLSGISAEIAAFVATRIKEDVDTQHEILQCEDLDEVRRIQEDFLKTAVSQYQAETGKLAQMGMEAFKVKTERSS